MTMRPNPDQVNQTTKSRLGIIWGAILIGLFGIAAGAAFLLLLLPALLAPPPSQAPAYDMFSSGEVTTKVDPARDRLLVSEDGQVALHVPIGAVPVIGTLVMQPRDYNLIPIREEGSIERIRAVDILMLDANGEIVQSPTFDPELLLCFRLSADLQKARDADSHSVMIQRFDERPQVLKWEDLAVGPGWDSDQICSTLTHLSILALAVDQGLDPRESSPFDQDVPSSERGPYSLPEDRESQ